MPRFRRTTASSRPRAIHRSSENQYGWIIAHACASVWRRLLPRSSGGAAGSVGEVFRVRSPLDSGDRQRGRLRSRLKGVLRLIHSEGQRSDCTEDSRMRQLVVGAVAVLRAGCAGPSVIGKEQAQAVKARDQALVWHADAIQAAIRQSGTTGALAFLDAADARLVILPGDTPDDAWTRRTASPASEAGRASVPPVVSFVYRADVPAAPETVSTKVLEQ